MGRNDDEFDTKAGTWDDSPERTRRAAAIARRIREQVPLHSDAHVLDFGSGTGLLGFHFMDEVASVTFADPSEGMLQQVEKKLQDGGHANGRIVRFDPDAPALPEHYDLIVSSMTLHHVPDPGAILRFLASHLAPGGWLALSDLDTEDGTFHDPPRMDVHTGFDRDALVSELRQLGLGHAQAVTAYVARLDRAGGTREYPLFLLTGQRAP